MEDSGSYSFYLNVIVLNVDASSSNNGNNLDSTHSMDSHEESGHIKEEKEPDEESSPAPPNTPDGKAEADLVSSPNNTSDVSSPTSANGDIADGDGDINNNTSNGGTVAKTGVNNKVTDDPKLKILMGSKKMMDLALNRKPKAPKAPKPADSNNNTGKGFMKSLSSSITKSSSNISKRASRFMASKTMVSRAEKAVNECIPLVTEAMGVEVSISKRFQQGPVFVLEVDMKGTHWIDLLKKLMGDEAAKHYACIKEGLEALNLPNTHEAMAKEILPKLRQAMMDKMSAVVPEQMKQKKQYEDLTIQVVALEDAEEAKWLYNFLAFMEDMK